MNNDRFLSTLGLARRAGKIVYGFDSVSESVNCIQLIYTASDISERTQRNIDCIVSKKNILIRPLRYTKNELGYSIGTKPVGIIGITDKGFTKLLISKEVTE